jgi:hypothetical protein
MEAAAADGLMRRPAPDPAAPLALLPEGGRLIAPLQGVPYLHFLRDLHRRFSITRYLEVGTRAGQSLLQAQGASIAIDPAFEVRVPVLNGKRQLHLYQMTSDAFFASIDPKPVLGGPVELAFVDGMHHYDFVLRDFANCEAHCGPDSLIVLHDCLPWSFPMTRRLALLANGKYEPVPGAWTGDVWKVVPILARSRPDLRITLFDCPPTGLVVVSRLDPRSRVLHDRMEELIAARDAEPDTAEGLRAWMQTARVTDSRAATEAGTLRELFLG